MKKIFSIFSTELSFALGVLFYSLVILDTLEISDISLYKIVIVWFLYLVVETATTLTTMEEGG